MAFEFDDDWTMWKWLNNKALDSMLPNKGAELKRPLLSFIRFFWKVLAADDER